MIDKGRYEQELKKIYRQFNAQELIYTQAKWMAYLKSDTAGIVTGTSTAVPWGLTNYDCLGIGISQNYGFVCPWKGLYFVIVYLQYGDTLADHTYQTRLFRNAGKRRHLGRVRGEGQGRFVGSPGGCIIKADRADELIAHAFHQDGTNNPILEGGSVYESSMTVHLLSRQCPATDAEPN